MDILERGTLVKGKLDGRQAATEAVGGSEAGEVIRESHQAWRAAWWGGFQRSPEGVLGGVDINTPFFCACVKLKTK